MNKCISCVPSEQEGKKKLPCPLQVDGCESGDMELSTEFGSSGSASSIFMFHYLPEFLWSVCYILPDPSHSHSKTAL